ncbi:FGGY-family carbohydrate kinase [Cellvibrio sp. NN19]|uniref:FGGY-family carbohydrate kinase n=1 Tax=Cellvibrio chitinivorans TaxID=3102792 RepID=UPI002B40A1A7|nr:FGGY family carbohydrate kinase [Cellvibrio sp. NN19]
MKAVLDIGKTNVKLQLVDDSGQLCDSYSRKNLPINIEPYPHADAAGIWQWLLATLTNYSQAKMIDAIIVTTHGATAALINSESGQDNDGLVLPILDYEFTGPNELDKEYGVLRPAFSESLSPDLPAGLNLGRQIFWLEKKFPEKFAKATHLLMYPQYWVWRLTGQLAGEVTSLGCHTDLWNPTAHHYSSLVEKCHWQRLLPPLQSAWASLGVVRPELAAATGLSVNCKVYLGLHDSNASYLRYLCNDKTRQDSFTVVSTGTWTILMQARGDLSDLYKRRDTLANCDVYGDPIACARFMGGREYDAICQYLGGDISMPISEQDVQTVLENLWMVTPDFSDGNGPYGGMKPQWHCPQSAAFAGAIATLYCALMIDQRLNDLQATGAIYIEGAFLKNPILCALVAQLRAHQPVYLSADDTGTVQGAILLTQFDGDASNAQAAVNLSLDSCNPSRFTGLNEYRSRWYELVELGEK